MQREEAGAQAALGREPDWVAGRAEGVADRGDEADATRGAIGDPVAGRRAGSRVHDRLERELVFDLLLDAAARHDLLVGPDVVSIEWHELDEADLVSLAVRVPREFDHLAVVVALHDDHVQLDRPEFSLSLRGDAVSYAFY